MSKQRGQWLTCGPGKACGARAQARRLAAGGTDGKTEGGDREGGLEG